MQCVILAGGLGTRMWPEARTIPKTLLPVAGKPFAAWQLSWLARSGIDSVVYCVGYLGGQVRGHVHDGAAWGLAVRYVDEGDQLRGTAGALRLAHDEGALADDFLVLYGDSWLQIDPAAVLRAARGRREPALMTVYRNEGRWDTSNVLFDGSRVVRYDKRHPTPDMKFIDYGLGVLSSALFDVVQEGVFDLSDLYASLAGVGRLAGFEETQRFYEIGTPSGLAEADSHLRGNL